MAGTVKSRVIVGGDKVYLNPSKFRRENHGAKVQELFSEMVTGYPEASALRPIQSHIYDFRFTYMGAWLIDGECKAAANEADISFMVLHSMDQLVTQDMSLCMLTASHRFTFYRSMKKQGTGHINTTVCELNNYELGQVDEDDR